MEPYPGPGEPSPPKKPKEESIEIANPMRLIRAALTKNANSTGKMGSGVGTPKPAEPIGQSKEYSTTLPASWIEEVFSGWENPVFPPVEPPIPRISNLLEGITPQVVSGSLRPMADSVSLGGSGEVPAIGQAIQISRISLRKAKIIGQVDKKFILVMATPDATGPTYAQPHPGEDPRTLLIIIDQHAADERCRVESLMSSYFSPDESGSGLWGARTEALEKSLVFELPKKEGCFFEVYQEHFEHWGIVFKVTFHIDTGREGGEEDNAKVEVQALPPSILERCRLEPKLLINLLRQEIWKLHDEPTVAAKREDKVAEEQGNRYWVSLFHGCPQGILDLINSRSCRSKSIVVTRS